MISEDYRFTVEKVRYKQDGKLYTRPMIVLKHLKTELIAAYTDFGDYVSYKVDMDVNINTKSEKYFFAVTQFLNYIFIEHHLISSLLDVTEDMIKGFLDDYSSTKMNNGRYPGKESVSNKRGGVCLFLDNFSKHHKMRYIKPGNLMKIKYVSGLNGRGTNKIIDYNIKVKYYDDENYELKRLIRDMPLSILELFIKMAKIYDPELTFAIILSAYVGFRESEVCNTRQVISKHPGFITTLKKEDFFIYKCTAMQIDLSTEYVMRDDLKDVGSIKRERIQSVFSPFVDIVYKYYQQHLELIKDKPCEDTKPIFLNKNKDRKAGVYRAMTKYNYNKRIIKLFEDHVLPACFNNPDPELARFYLMMQGRTWGAHAFRHWYTVFLILSGVDDVAQLMNLRGDRNPESARTYLRNKGILREKYTKAAQKLGLMIRDA